VSFLLLGPTEAALPPAPGPARRAGLVRLDGKKFVDAGGAWNPRGISFFTWPWGLKHEEARYRDNMAWVAGHGFDAARVWGKVGGTSWEDREYSVETDPDALARALDVAWGEYGVRLDIALIADNFDLRDPASAARALREVIRPRQESVLCSECANEDNMPNEAENLRRVFEILRGAFPDMPIAARSAPGVEGEDRSDLDAFPYANVMSAHTDRQPPPERQIRAHWGAEGHHRAMGSFEPPGPWSSGATMDDPIHLALTSTMAGIAGMGYYVFHAGAGIRTGGQHDRQRGLPENFFDQQNGDEQARGVIAGGHVLPPDCVDWRKINGHWRDHPMPARWVWSDGWTHGQGISRGYAIERGDQFLNIVLAVRGLSEHPILRDCAIEVLHPVTGELLDTQVLRGGAVHHALVPHPDNPEHLMREITGDGETYTLRGPDAGGLWGYVIRGRYR